MKKTVSMGAIVVVMALSLFSCEEENTLSNRLVPEAMPASEQPNPFPGLMSFDSFEDFENAAKANTAAKGPAGFVSLMVLYRQTKKAETSMLAAVGTMADPGKIKAAVRAFVENTNRHSHIAYQEGEGIGMRLFNPRHAKLVDTHGLVAIGGDLYQFHQDHYRVIEKQHLPRGQAGPWARLFENPEIETKRYAVTTTQANRQMAAGRTVKGKENGLYVISRPPQKRGLISLGNHRFEFEIKHIAFTTKIYQTRAIQACDMDGDNIADVFYENGVNVLPPAEFDPLNQQVPAYGCGTYYFTSVVGERQSAELHASAKGKRDAILATKIHTESYSIDEAVMNIDYSFNGLQGRPTVREVDTSGLNWVRAFNGAATRGHLACNFLLKDNDSGFIHSYPRVVNVLRIDL